MSAHAARVQGDGHGGDGQGSGDISGAVRRRCGAIQFLRVDLPLGGFARLQGRANSKLGRAAVRSRQGRRSRRPIATKSPASPPSADLRSPSYRRTCRASSSPSIPPMTKPSTLSRRPTHGKPAERQKWAVGQMLTAAQSLAPSRPEGARDILRRARLAVRLPVAATRRRTDRDRLRRTGAALDADPQCVRRGRRRCRLRDPSRRRPVRRRDLRAFP